MLSGIPMNNHNWMIHVCSSTIVNCANYLSPKTKQPIIKIKSLCHNPYFQNMVLILYAHSLPLCTAKSKVIPHHKVNGQYSWMNGYVLHFVYGDLKLHCDLEFFVAILLFCFHPKFIIYPDGIFTYKTLKGPASACLVEATHIKKKRRSGRQSCIFQLYPLWRLHLYCYRFLSFAQHELDTREGCMRSMTK